MADLEESVSHKRKASPSPDTDDAERKRIKVADNLEDHQSDHGVEDTEIITHDDASGNGAAPGEEHHVGEDKSREDTNSGRVRRRSSAAGDEVDASAARVVSDMRRTPVSGPSRGSITTEEKKRGKRLFGGLLSTLNERASKSNNTQQKRRLEIERRQHEKAEQQKAEDDKARAERLAKLANKREVEQVKFDEEVMEARHQSMLDRARLLSTKAQPSLYYMPARLTSKQDAQMEEQVRDTTEAIERETQTFRRRKEQRLAELGVANPPKPDAPVGDSQTPKDTNNPPPSSKAPPGEPANKVAFDDAYRDLDKLGDVVRDQEDDVLY